LNNRDRFRAVLRFERTDRLPRFEWATWWDQTIRRWEGEGLPTERPGGEAGVVAIMEHFGLDPVWQTWFPIHKPGYPPMPHGQGPVCDMASYEAVREFLYPEVDWDACLPQDVRERHERGELAVWYTLNGFFWFPRTLMGIERHMYAFYDMPDVMKRINEDLLEYNLKIVEELADRIEPEFMTLAEDLSYNHGPMLSKATFDEFMRPYYQTLTEAIRKRNVVAMVDSDGNVEACLPWFIEAGIEGLLPFERQSGVDVARVRANHPRFCMIGAFDKMTMPRGKDAMREEWERLLPVMRQGGFIPSVDHQTPPGVSMAQYRDYLELMWEYTARACS